MQEAITALTDNNSNNDTHHSGMPFIKFSIILFLAAILSTSLYLAFKYVSKTKVYGISSVVVSLPGKIQAEDYDSFYDKSSKNIGGAYKTDAVDIEKTGDVGGGYNVGWIANGEWLQYKVDVAVSGKYNLNLRYARGMPNNTSLKIELDGKVIANNVVIPSTNGWQKWTTLTVKDVVLTKKTGGSNLRIVFTGGNNLENNMNLNWIEFISTTPTPPPAPLPAPIVAAVYACTPVQINLSWSKLINTTGYEVERCTGKACTNFSLISSVTNPSAITYLDNNVVTNSTYRYRIRGYTSDPKVDGYWSTYLEQTINCTPSTTVLKVPGKIQAEDYNPGGQNIGYFDTSPESNTGGKYRKDGVDIETTSDTGGGYNVGWIYPGEWLKYNVQVEKTGLYDVEFRVARGPAGVAQLMLEQDGEAVTNNIDIPATGGWQTWKTITVKNVPLKEGSRVLRLVVKTTFFNINWINFKLSPLSDPNPTPTPTPTPDPEPEPAPLACMSGYNSGMLVNANQISNAVKWNMDTIVTIVETKEYAYSLAQYIKTANDNGILPIVRICYKNSDPNYCKDFKNPNDTVNFITSVEGNLRASDKYVFIAGPNEPISEGWLLPTGSTINLETYPHLQPNMPAYLAYFKSLGQYTKTVYDGVKTKLSAARKANVQIIGAAFNFNYHGCSNRKEFISAYRDGLGTGGFNSIDGIAGNDYTTSNTKPESCYQFLHDNFFGNLNPNFKVYFTEFGPVSQSTKANLATSYKKLNEFEEVYSVNFFSPFSTDNEQFKHHNLTDAELTTILQCK